MNQELEQKYIELLLKKCLNFQKSSSLFISYEKENRPFINRLVDYAKTLGIKDIYLEENDSYHKHDILKSITKEEITTHPLFNKQIWDEYAKKDANFLMFVTEIPDLMKDIEPEKITAASLVSRKTKPLYAKKQSLSQIPWCIAALPGQKWAEQLFPQAKDAYNKLFHLIIKMCKVDTENPIISWTEQLTKLTNIVTKLNSLEITKLHYTNSLGTDLYLTLPKNHQWASASDGNATFLANMPSYEVFTTPDYRQTNGIVYSSLPLIYGGAQIKDFWLEFQNGKVINYNAKEGKEVLKGIIESDEQSCYLGECALVDINTPISQSNTIFGSTLFDENASCHLALGEGFPECLKTNSPLTESELLKQGINVSQTHVDFMIGTNDLTIEAQTNQGKIQIFKNGHFNL